MICLYCPFVRIKGKNIWQTFADRHTITEHDVANVIRRLLEALDYMEENKIVHAAIHVSYIKYIIVFYYFLTIESNCKNVYFYSLFIIIYW